MSLLLALQGGGSTVSLAGKARSTQRALAAALTFAVALSGGTVREVERTQGQITSNVALQGAVREVEKLTAVVTSKVALQGTVREVERLKGYLTGKVALQGTVREVELLQGQLSITVQRALVGGKGIINPWKEQKRKHQVQLEMEDEDIIQILQEIIQIILEKQRRR